MIGQNVTIKRSIIWDNTEIHDNCTIVDSLICDNVVINRNCVIEAGIRLDKNVQVKEGVVLASNTMVSCRSVVQANFNASIEFPPIEDVEETCFTQGAIIDEVPIEMALEAH